MRHLTTLTAVLVLGGWTVAAAQDAGQPADAVDESAPTAEEIEVPAETEGAEANCDPSAGGAVDAGGEAPSERDAALAGCAPDEDAEAGSDAAPMEADNN